MVNKKYNFFYNKKAWYGFCIILSLIVFVVYLNGYKINFYYDDYNFFRNYSNAELISALFGDWNFGQRLENAGYRPFAIIIYDIIWNLFGVNVFYYRIISVLLLFMSGFLAYKIFRIYNKDRILITLGSILFVIFSDQFVHRIWLTEIPSFSSNVLTLLGIYIVLKKCDLRSVAISYFLIVVASMTKETNLPFLIVPIIAQLFNQKNFKITYSIIIQALCVGMFVALIVYIRSIAFSGLAEHVTTHSFGGLDQLIYLAKRFLLQFSPSLGLSQYALLIAICFLFGGFLFYVIKEGKLPKLPTKFYFIFILIILSMASFPFYSGGRLRVFFVCFSLLALLTFLSNVNNRKPFVSYILISFLIILNCTNNFIKTKGLISDKNWLSQSIYFSPYFRTFMQQGNDDALLHYLKDNDLDLKLSSSYNNLISSLTKKTTITKTGEFIDDLGIEFVSLRIEGNKKLNIMKYEFRPENLNGYLFVTPIPYKPWKVKSDLPINGVRHYRIAELIEYLNKKNKKYNYRLPTVQEYVWLTGGYKTIYEKNINKFAAINIKSVFNTTPNELGIYGLKENVGEWTQNKLDSNFVALFGGDAHYGSHNIVYADHKRRAKAGTFRLYGFRLVAYTINNQ